VDSDSVFNKVELFMTQEKPSNISTNSTILSCFFTGRTRGGLIGAACGAAIVLSTINHYESNKYVVKPAPKTIISQFWQASDRIFQRINRNADGITSTKGWHCFSGNALQENMPELHKKLSLTQIGQSTLKTLVDHKIDICVAPDNIFNAKFPNSGGNYIFDYNSVQLKTSDTSSATVAHETHHGEEAGQTNGHSHQLEVNGELTKAMQAKLLLEAGSVAIEVLDAFQQKATGNPKPYQEIYDNSKSTYISLILVIESAIKKDPYVAAYFKNPVNRAPAPLLDSLYTAFLHGAYVERKTVVEPGIRYWLSDYTKSFTKLYADKAPQMDFDPAVFDNKLVLGLTGNAEYPANTEFPETVKAINDLGTQMAPLIKQAVTYKISTAQIEEMASDFVGNLRPQPHRYQTAQNAGKWSGTPRVTL